MSRQRAQWIVVAIVAIIAISLFAGASTEASGGKGTVVVPAAKLAWVAGAIPGVSTAAVAGDLATGPSRFYLKYAKGLVTPLHHHSPDHYVTTVTGELVLVVDGVEHRLAPGSYFALTNQAAHLARCEGATDCVMFIDSRGAWDVVPDAPAKP